MNNNNFLDIKNFIFNNDENVMKRVSERETDSLESVEDFWELFDDETDEIENEVKEINKDNYLEIAKIISNNDEKVMERVSKCVTDPLKYFEKYNESFDDRGMDEDNETDEIIWIGILDILIENGYIIEEDWKECLNTFIDDVNSFKVMQDAGIEVGEDLDCLKKDENIGSWARVLDEEPVMQGYVIGLYNIGADCYDFFVCTKEKLDALSKLAEDVGQMICRCSEC